MLATHAGFEFDCSGDRIDQHQVAIELTRRDRQALIAVRQVDDVRDCRFRRESLGLALAILQSP
jgi:hypothetical protein